MTSPLPLKTQWYHWPKLKRTQVCHWMTSCLLLPTSLQQPTPANTPQHQESMTIPYPWGGTGSGPDRLLSACLELCNSLEMCLHGPSDYCKVFWMLQPNWFSFYPPYPARAARTQFRHWCLPLLLWKARSCSKSRTPRPLDHTLTVSVAPSPFNKILTDCCPGSLTHGTNSPLTSNQQKLCTSLVESWTTYLSIWKKHNIHLFFGLYPNGWTHFIYLSCFEEKHLLNKSNVLWLQFAICSHF